MVLQALHQGAVGAGQRFVSAAGALAACGLGVTAKTAALRGSHVSSSRGCTLTTRVHKASSVGRRTRGVGAARSGVIALDGPDGLGSPSFAVPIASDFLSGARALEVKTLSFLKLR
jgi:hypothetical protein